MMPLAEWIYNHATLGGWTAGANLPVKESDTTGICFAALGHLGYDLDPELLYQYEETMHFRCYSFERNPSISANAHVLSGLHYCDPLQRKPRIEKLIQFLTKTRVAGGYWFDKWHVSPYYTTCHVLLAAHDIAPDLVEPATQWMIHTQWQDGGWGWYTPTLEETAYAVLALLVWRRNERNISQDVQDALVRGIEYLRQHFSATTLDYPPLWIAKTLYTPLRVVQGLLFATLLAAQADGF
jgi:halimadienyl-diphosphate synthase